MKNLIILILLLLSFVSCSSSVPETPKTEKEKENVAEKTKAILAGKTFQSICEGELSTKIIFINDKKAKFIFHEFWSEDSDNAGEITRSATVDYQLEGENILIERMGIKYVFLYSQLQEYPNSTKGLRLISLTGEGDEFFNAEGCQKILIEVTSDSK